MNHEHVFKVPEHAFPGFFPPSFCSQSTCPLGEPGFITPIPLPTSAEASQSSACSGVPRCHRASFCLLKGMLAEGRVAESCFRAAVKCSGWYWGGEGGAWSTATCPHAAFRAGSQSSKDQTLHMKVHCHQLQLSFHLFQPPPLGSPDGNLAPFLSAALPPSAQP